MTWTEGFHATGIPRTTSRVKLKELVQESRRAKREDGSYASQESDGFVWPPWLLFGLALPFMATLENGWFIIVSSLVFVALAVLLWPHPPHWGVLDCGPPEGVWS